MENGELNDKESQKTIVLLLLAIVMIGDNTITSYPALLGVGIMVYLLINSINLLRADQKQKRGKTPTE